MVSVDWLSVDAISDTVVGRVLLLLLMFVVVGVVVDFCGVPFVKVVEGVIDTVLLSVFCTTISNVVDVSRVVFVEVVLVLNVVLISSVLNTGSAVVPSVKGRGTLMTSDGLTFCEEV